MISTSQPANPNTPRARIRPGLVVLGLGLGLAAALLSGCDQKPLASQAHGSASDFDPVAFFSGHTRSWGVIENRSGAPTQQIVTEGQGTPAAPIGL